ncbi:MAG TPA: GNAT family N-acetyltransferase [Pseudomonadales bacterium]
MTGGRSFTLRDVNVYRPYPDEIPWELLEAGGAAAEQADADLMRVAKLDGEAVAVYQLRELDPTRYELVALAVAPDYRRRGLGRWLLGHAIGIAESRGAREIWVRRAQLKGLFLRIGFKAENEALVLRLTPE